MVNPNQAQRYAYERKEKDPSIILSLTCYCGSMSVTNSLALGELPLSSQYCHVLRAQHRGVRHTNSNHPRPTATEQLNFIPYFTPSPNHFSSNSTPPYLPPNLTIHNHPHSTAKTTSKLHLQCEHPSHEAFSPSSSPALLERKPSLFMQGTWMLSLKSQPFVPLSRFQFFQPFGGLFIDVFRQFNWLVVILVYRSQLWCFIQLNHERKKTTAAAFPTSHLRRDPFLTSLCQTRISRISQICPPFLNALQTRTIPPTIHIMRNASPSFRLPSNVPSLPHTLTLTCQILHVK